MNTRLHTLFISQTENSISGNVVLLTSDGGEVRFQLPLDSINQIAAVAVSAIQKTLYELSDGLLVKPLHSPEVIPPWEKYCTSPGERSEHAPNHSDDDPF